MRKITALLLTLLMLALPVMSLAATNVTVTLSPSEALASLLGDEVGSIYRDMVNALGVTGYKDAEGRQGGVALLLNGTEAASFDAAAKDDTLYLKSNFLGDKVLAVSAEEWEPLLGRLIDLLATAGGLAEEDVQQMKAELAAAMAGGLSQSVAPELTEADILALDWTPVIEAAMPAAEKAEVAEVKEQPEGCDAASQVMTMVLTSEDIAAVYQAMAQVMRSSDAVMAYLDTTLAGAGMSGAQLLDAMVEDVKTATVNMKDATVIVYLNDAGDVVCADMPVEIADEDETVKVAASYKRLTDENGVNHQFSMPMTVDGEQLLAFDLAVLDAGDAGMITLNANLADAMELTAGGVFDNENVDITVTMAADDMNVEVKVVGSKEATDFSLTMDADGTVIALSIANATTVNEQETVRTGTVNLGVTEQGATVGLLGSYAASSATDGSADKVVCELGVDMMGNQLPLVTVMVDVDRTAEAKASIVTEDAIHLAQLSDEELNALGAEIAQTAMNQAIALVQSLPESVLSLMMAQ